MDLGGVAEHGLVGLGQVGDDLDVGGDGGAEEACGFSDDREEAGGAAWLLAAAAEGENLGDEVAGAVARGDDVLDVGAEWMGGCQVEVGELGVAKDDAEDVVDIVGDAAGEGADGFELLSLAELALEFEALLLLVDVVGDVACVDDAAVRALGRAEVAVGALEEAPLVGGVDDADAHRGFAGLALVEHEGGAILGVDHVDHGLADEVVWGEAQEQFMVGAGVAADAMGIDLEDEVVEVFEEEAVALFAGAQGDLGAFAFGDIGEDRDEVTGAVPCHVAGGDLDCEALAVAVAELLLAAADFAVDGDLVEEACAAGEVGPEADFGDEAAEGFLTAQAEEAFAAVVELDDALLVVGDDDDGVGAELENALEACLAGVEGALGFALAGEVAQGAEATGVARPDEGSGADFDDVVEAVFGA